MSAYLIVCFFILYYLHLGLEMPKSLNLKSLFLSFYRIPEQNKYFEAFV